MAYSANELSRDLYRILDQVLESGVGVEIERNGRLLRIMPVEHRERSESLPSLPDLIVGDPGDLARIDWFGDWTP